jgi:hypothetical protein
MAGRLLEVRGPRTVDVYIPIGILGEWKVLPKLPSRKRAGGYRRRGRFRIAAIMMATQYTHR